MVPARILVAFVVAATLALSISSARAAENEADCLGIGFDAERPLAVAEVVSPEKRVHFVKSPWEDKDCPSLGESCRAKAYLVPGDLVLASRTRGPFTCVSYQDPKAQKFRWASGWVPAASLKPVPAMAAPKSGDWIGGWERRGGRIGITRAEGGKLAVEGEAVIPTAQDVHTGVLGAEARPQGAVLAFAEDGGVPFDKADESQCRVRMQRVRAHLLVEDNGACGGVAVSFTGLYRRARR